MTESQDTCDPLIATLLRALVARSGGHITVTTNEIAAAARAGDIRTTWGGIGHGIEVRLIAPAATTSPTPPEIKPPTRRSRLRYGARIGTRAA